MVGYLVRRLLWAVPTVLCAVLAVFVAVRMLGNNPVAVKFGQHAVPSQVEAEMKRQGWDRPIAVQAVDFFYGLATRGDLGRSFFTGQPVAGELAKRFAATIELTLGAAILGFPTGLALGILAAVYRNRWPDYVCSAIATVGVSVPVFFLGLCLMLIFTELPTGRQLPIGAYFPRTTDFIVIESVLRGRFEITAVALWHLLLPAAALATIPLAYIARITRGSLIEILSADYIRTAKAKGTPPWRVILRHALPNAAIPIVNIAGLQLGVLLSGAVLTESVFSWPGIGRRLVEAVLESDYAVVQGGALFVAVMFVMLNLGIDLTYAWLDPRVRLAGTADE